MTLAAIGLRNLCQRPVRTALTVSGVAVAFGALIVLTGVSRGLERSWIDGLRQQGADMLAVRRNSVNILSATLDAGVARQMAAVSGVRAVAGELVDLVQLESGERVLVSGWEEGTFLWDTQPVLRGRLPAPDQRRGAAIGQPVAEVLRKSIGDEIQMGGSSFRVTGILGASPERSLRLIIVPLRALQDVMLKGGRVTVFALRLAQPTDPTALAEVQARLSRAFPDLSFRAIDHVADNDVVLRMLRAFAWGTSAIALVLALVVATSALLMSVMERTSEIGVLSAVGWSRTRIVGLLTGEGLMVTAVGSAVGTGLGLGALRWLAHLPAVAGSLKTDVTAAIVIEVFVAFAALALPACAYPAWRAARLVATEALRSE